MMLLIHPIVLNLKYNICVLYITVNSIRINYFSSKQCIIDEYYLIVEDNIYQIKNNKHKNYENKVFFFKCLYMIKF
jgi:hypothetical protein